VRLEELCTRRVAVWGLGQEGLAMTRLLADRGVEPLLIDDRAVEAASGLDASLGRGHHVVDPAEVDWTGVDVVVRAPGVSRYRPELEMAEGAGVVVTTAMAMWFEDFADARVMAVTGTKGKSTTATLARAILGHGGLDVALIGNIGVPATAMYGRPPVDAYVVEVSSFQAAEVALTPGVCVLTSLAPDHLDWHRTEEAYYRDKLRLIDVGPPGALAVNAGSDEAIRRTAGHADRTLFGPSGRVRVGASGAIEADGVPLVDGGLLRAPGRHNLWNLCGAVAGAMLLTGLSPAASAVEAAVDGFAGLPSRCLTVGERYGLTFVDDALASNPFATVASISAFAGRELTVILGGADRGVDPGDLVKALTLRRPRPRVVVLPPDPDRLVDALGSAVPIEVVTDLAGAVASAVVMTPPGGVVLFSPAAPTPTGEGGFSERSRRFVEAIGLTGREQP
jgi:UDP-N-acetylmuramoyl-L-alanine---L-glutamate ligase